MSDQQEVSSGPYRLENIAAYMDYGDQSALMALSQEWRADRAEAKEIRQLGMRYMVDLASMTARATRAEAALERARALLVEQAEVITANVWHIPPEYSSRNAVLDAAVKMRELAAALAAAPGGAA